MSESDQDELEAMLASLPGQVLPLDAWHGVLTAVLMAGDARSLEDWVPGVLSSPPISGATMGRLIELLSLLRAEVDAALDDPDYLFAPMVRMHRQANGSEVVDGRVWCAGFLFGMNLCREAWSQLLTVPGVEQGLWSVYRMGECCEEVAVALDPALQRGKLERPLSAAQCDALTEHLPQALEAVWSQVIEHQVDATMQAVQSGQEEPAWREDEPCPCGSGKGFLDCCGGGRVLH